MFRLVFRLAKIVVIVVLVASTLPVRAETLPNGTNIVVRLNQEIRPDGKTKQRFTASLAYPVFIDGHQVLPLGTRIEGDVRGSKKSIFLSPRTLILPDGKKLDFYASVGGITSKRLEAQSKEGTIEKKGGSKGEAAQQAGQIGTEGAIIGVMSTGTATGAAIGAAAGVGAVLIGRKIAGAKGSAVIPAGSQITLSLNRPIDVPDNVEDALAPETNFPDREDRRPILRREDPPPEDPQPSGEAQ